MFKTFLAINFLMSFNILAFSQGKITNDIDFLIDKVKNSYAGYPEKIKGSIFLKFVSKIKQSNSKDTFALLSKITSFFNDLHLVLYDYNVSKNIDTNKCKAQEESTLKYLENKSSPKDIYEGYWLSEYGNCIIGLIKNSNFPVSYTGYVIETKTKAIQGFTIFKLVSNKNGYFDTDYKEEGLGYRIILKSKFRDLNTLLINSYGKWKKIDNYKKGMLSFEKEFSYTPSLKIIDDKNVLLKLPDFGAYNVKYIDSIITANREAITNAKTLIVDIRNNMGGTIKNYLPLLPFIYTQPIVNCGIYQKCSQDLIEDFKEDIRQLNTKGDTAKANKYKNKLDSIIKFKGRFRYFPPDTLANRLPIRKNPQNVALIVNNNCLSAAELMILNFKQSNKVKVFGETTGGAVDYLDALIVELPSKKYTLFMATGKREILSEKDRYDGKGIKPDVEISDNVPDWVEFVKKYYETQ